MNRAEQIASTAVDEWDADDGLTIDMTLAEWVCHRLRLAGIDLDHTYEQPTDKWGGGLLLVDGETLWSLSPAEEHSGKYIPAIDAVPAEPLFVRRALDGAA